MFKKGNAILVGLTGSFNQLAQEQLRYIRRGLDQLELLSCIKFVEWSGEPDYIEVIVSTNLHSIRTRDFIETISGHTNWLLE